MSGIFGSVVIKGNRLTDFAGQTATVGIPIPFGYGKFVAQGNIIAASELRETPVRRRQGKGGVKTEDYEYTCDYAIGFAKGPIFGFWTIKRDGKVVYSSDPATPVEDQEFAAKWLEKATLYYGTEDQEPDSTLEAFKGVGQVSAFKGLAYIVLENDNVTAGQGAVPQYEAVVIANSIGYVSSTPYEVALESDLYRRSGALTSGVLRTILIETDVGVEGYSREGSLISGQLKNYVNEYTLEVDDYRRSGELVAGQLRNVVIEYTNALPEGYARTGSLIAGSLETVVVEYTAQPEGYTRTGSLIGGSLV